MAQRIAYLTDLHLDEQYPKDWGADAFYNWKTVLQHLATQTVDKVIVGGDLGTPSTTAYFFDSLSKYQELHLTLGNHDQFASVLPYFPKAQEDPNKQALYYSFLEEGYLYIFLDSSPGSLPTSQMAWLEQQLKTDHPVLLFIHHPIFGIENCLADELFPLKNRTTLQQLLLNSGLDISIFCGHYHILHQQVIGKIKQYITPATSVQFDTQAEKLHFHADSFGYRIIEVGENGIHSELYNFNP